MRQPRRARKASLAAKAIGMPKREDAGQQIQRRGKRLEADRMRKCGPGQYYEAHEQEHGDARTVPRMKKGTTDQQWKAAAGENEGAGEGDSHGEVKKETKCCAGPAAGVGALPERPLATDCSRRKTGMPL